MLPLASTPVLRHLWRTPGTAVYVTLAGIYSTDTMHEGPSARG